MTQTGFWKIKMVSKDPGPEDQALVSPHRGVIVTLLNMIGMLEYWSIGVLGLKSELSSISDHLNTHVSYEVYCDPKPIIPLLLLHSLLA